LFLSGLQNSVGGNEVRTLFVIAELLSETQGDVSKGLFRHCERSEAIQKTLVITGLLRRSSSQ
jgi:hypothetical protein